MAEAHESAMEVDELVGLLGKEMASGESTGFGFR